MEGGIHRGADKSAFRECFSLTWKNPYVLRLAFSAGIGGLLFGYDTGKFLNLLSAVSLIYIHVWLKFDGLYIYMQELYQELCFISKKISRLLTEKLGYRFLYVCFIVRIYKKSVLSYDYFLGTISTRLMW